VLNSRVKEEEEGVSTGQKEPRGRQVELGGEMRQKMIGRTTNGAGGMGRNATSTVAKGEGTYYYAHQNKSSSKGHHANGKSQSKSSWGEEDMTVLTSGKR